MGAVIFSDAASPCHMLGRFCLLQLVDGKFDIGTLLITLTDVSNDSNVALANITDG